MSKSMRIQLDGAFIAGQSSDPKVQRLMYPWTGTQGPIISGKLIITPRDDITLKALTLTFTAAISCHWSEGQGNSTAHFSARKPLLEKAWVFLEKSETKLHLLRAKQTYAYDFQLALPVNLPNSLAMSTGKIEYLFSANGKRPAFVGDLAVDRVVEIYQSLPPSHEYCTRPVQQTADFEHALNYLVQIPRKAFHHGAVIPITIRMNPIAGAGARWLVKSMHIKIREYVWFISPGKGVRHEKRSLVEAVQGSGSWPVQVGPVERTISVGVPASNVMTTVDTEIIKCTHALKIVFTVDFNGFSRKLSTDFDLYIPGPFPPGQGSASVPPLQSLPGHPPLAQPHQQYAYMQQQNYSPMQPPLPGSALPPYPGQPYPAPLQTPYNTQQIPYPVPPTATASTPGSTPGVAAATLPPHPYHQGFTTPTTAHSYPMVTSSQGYPTPAMPQMPSPSVPNYPLPPSPALGHAPNQSVPVPMPCSANMATPSPGLIHMTMPAPSPTPSAALASYAQATFSPTTHSANLVASHHQPKDGSPREAVGSQSLQIDDTIKVHVTDNTIKANVVDDTIKVNIDDIKIHSAPPTPVTSVARVAPTTPSAANRSKNPQLRESYIGPPDGGSNVVYESPPVATKTNAPHTVNEAGESNFTYQPPPPLSSAMASPLVASSLQNTAPYAVVAAARASPTVMNSGQQYDLSSQFTQMGLQARPAPPPSPSTLSSHAVVASSAPSTPATSAAPGAYPNSNYSSSMSPMSAAATGAVIASQQQQYQPPPPPSAATSIPPPQTPLMSQPQPGQPAAHHYLQQQQQHGPPPLPKRWKQQVWIPMYQTIAGKTYVQYKPGA